MLHSADVRALRPALWDSHHCDRLLCNYKGEPLENRGIRLSRASHKANSYLAISAKFGELRVRIPPYIAGQFPYPS